PAAPERRAAFPAPACLRSDPAAGRTRRASPRAAARAAGARPVAPAGAQRSGVLRKSQALSSTCFGSCVPPPHKHSLLDDAEPPVVRAHVPVTPFAVDDRLAYAGALGRQLEYADDLLRLWVEQGDRIGVDLVDPDPSGAIDRDRVR